MLGIVPLKRVLEGRASFGYAWPRLATDPQGDEQGGHRKPEQPFDQEEEKAKDP